MGKDYSIKTPQKKRMGASPLPPPATQAHPPYPVAARLFSLAPPFFLSSLRPYPRPSFVV